MFLTSDTKGKRNRIGNEGKRQEEKEKEE